MVQMFDRGILTNLTNLGFIIKLFSINILYLIKRIKAPLLIIFMAHAGVHTVLMLVTKPGCLYCILKYFKPILHKAHHTKRYI